MDSMFTITSSGFAFFLLVVCVGYIFLKDLKKGLENEGSLERLINYILYGIALNFFFLLIISLFKSFQNSIASWIYSSGDISANLGNLGIPNSRFVIFALGYFVLLIVFVLSVKKIIRMASRPFKRNF